MRSSEFLNEQDSAPMTDAEFAAQRAQGAKNWDAVKGFGRKIAGALGQGQPITTYPDAATARANLTPSQLKWLGGADPSDKSIMSRMPAALPGETVAPAAAPLNIKSRNDGTLPPLPAEAPAATAPAAPSALPAGMTPAQVDQAQNRTEPAEPAATPVATPAEPAVAPAAANATQAATPPPAKAKSPARSTASPAVVGYASSMGLYKNGRPDTAAIKAFQQKNGLKADGIIGPDTSGAILSAAKPGDAGSGRGGQGGPTAAQLVQADYKTGNPAIPRTAPRRDSNTQRQTLAKTMPGAPVSEGATNADRRDFEESVNRMRRLSTLLKG
jgi:hypothetical protein